MEAPIVEALDLTRYPAGSRQYLRFSAGIWADGSPLTIPMTVLKGRRDNPRLVAVAGVHGDELVGPRALTELANEIDPTTLDGTVVLVPVANPPAFNAGMRESPVDGLNLNRIFPGRLDGTVTQRLAYALIHGIIAGTDLAIDLHCAQRTALMMPLSGYRDGTGDVARRSALAAAAFRLTLPWLMAWQPGTLSTTVNQLGIPAVGCEIGGQGIAVPEHVLAYKDGILRCIRHAGIMAPAIEVELPATIWTHRDVATPTGGQLELRVELGQRVGAGEQVASILNPWGAVAAEIAAPNAGLITYTRTFSTIQAGETVVMIGEEQPHPLR